MRVDDGSNRDFLPYHHFAVVFFLSILSFLGYKSVMNESP